MGSDSISSILEDMKSTDENLGAGTIEYATAIPVAVTSLASDPKKTTIKRVAAPASTVILPGGNKTSRNIIFAGNTLPQGAIPIQINGLNAIPISAVKSLPINLSTLTPTSAPVITTNSMSGGMAAKKTKVEIVTARPGMSTGTKPGIITQLPAGANIVTTKLTNNNNSTNATIQQHLQKVTPVHVTSPPSQAKTMPSAVLQSNITKAIGNNKTCNWVFENGEVCGKTFSKSYNLVVHMRMHEDVRPFGCSLCDQTFRQKAHLQRHETTHGIGVKVNRGSSSTPRRKRKRSRGGGPSGSGSTPMAPLNQTHTGVVVTTTPVTTPLSAQLQQRLARVSEQFGGSGSKKPDGTDSEEDLSVNTATCGDPKSYSKRKGDEAEEEGDDGESSPKLRKVAVRLEDGSGSVDESGNATATADGTTGSVSAAGQATQIAFQSSYVEVKDEVADLREEDMIESVSGITTSGVTAATTTDAVHVTSGSADSKKAEGQDQEILDNLLQPDNVKVDAQPITTVTNMSPETLTAISGQNSPQPETEEEKAKETPDSESKKD